MNSYNRARLVRASVLAILASAAGRTPYAQAQASEGAARSESGPDNDATQTLEEVTVTANRRSESVLKVPYNISATTEQQLESAGVTDYSKLAQVVPGLIYNGGGIREGGSQSGFILRGLNSDRTSTGDQPSLTVAPVSVYLDDTPLFANLRLTDIARVEVLRGPQGTLYGNGSVGGTIRFIYNEPDPTAFAARIQAQTSQTEHAPGLNRAFDGVLNIPLAESLAVRISAGHTFEQGFTTAKNLFALGADGTPLLQNPGAPLTSLPVTLSKRDIDDSRQGFVHGALKYQSGPWKVILSVHHQEESADGVSADTRGVGALPTAFSSAVTPGFRNDGFDAAIPPVYGKNETGIFVREPYDRRIDLESLEVSREFGFATLTSSTSYFENESHATQDLSGSYQTNLAALYLGFPRLAVAGQRNTRERTFAEELRLVSTGDGPLKWVAGLFYQDQRQQLANVDRMLGWGPFASALFGAPTTEDRAFDYHRQMRFRDLALFGEVTYNLTDRWQVTGGLRGFDQKLDIATVTKLPICGVFCANDGTDPEGTTLGGDNDEHRRVLGKFNTSYNVTLDTMVYLTVSEGFRRGGANAVPTVGRFAQDPALVAFAPDTVRSYELGMKERLGEFRLTADVFQADWSRPQLNILTPVGGFYAAVNGNKARSRGLELALDGRLTRNLSVTTGYSYTDAKLVSDFSVAGLNLGASGDRLPGVPKHQFTLGLDYNQPVTADYTLVAHADTAYRSNVITALPGSLGGSASVDGFWMTSISIGLDRASWRATVFLDNVFNERGVTTELPASAMGARHEVKWLSRPRTAGVRVSYSFGK